MKKFSTSREEKREKTKSGEKEKGRFRGKETFPPEEGG